MIRFEQIWENYLADRLTPEEAWELQQLLLQSDSPVPGAIDRMLAEGITANVTRPEHKEAVFNRMMQRLPVSAPVRHIHLWKRIAVAAAVLLMTGLGIYYYIVVSKRPSAPEVAQVQPGKDVTAPQTNRAMITLANGDKVYLDSAANGQLANEGTVSIVKLADGQVAYKNNDSLITHHPVLTYNTLSNPRGSKVIDMILSDGSHVWLNTGSSITYPVAFTGNERKVSITGEAYFEITHNAAKPFKVSKGDMEVTVLGTHFNVNAYDDEEDIKVTLLEGSVKVKSESPIQGTSLEKAGKSGNNAVVLKPGEQASISEIRDPIRVIRAIQVIRDIDIEQVLSWKNGLFSFKGADIKTIMRQISRWYNVDVEYAKEVTEKFHVEMSRNTNISNVFKILETTGGVHFKIENKKVIVLP